MTQCCKKNDVAFIDIIVPHLTHADFSLLCQSLQCDDNGGDSYGCAQRIQASTRARMFSCEVRKFSIWHEDPYGKEWVMDNEYDVERHARRWRIVAEEAATQYPFLRGEGDACFFIHKHEHRGMTGAVVPVGWMMESWLQQRGIPYLCNNRSHGSVYAYNPQERRIVMINDIS